MAEYRPGYSVHGGDPAAANIESSIPGPPASAAGLTHSTWTPWRAVAPSWRLTPWPGRPNTLSAGGGDGYDEYAMTQPVCAGRWHAGMEVNEPPSGRPGATVTFPPRMTADTT